MIYAAQSISHSVDRLENISIFEFIFFTNMGSIPQQLLRDDAVYKCFSADVHTQHPHWQYYDDSNDSKVAIKTHNLRIIVAVGIKFPIGYIQLADNVSGDRSADDS